jgi:DMSO/TMAO reductase YedYZ heme-binding membrane subunit
MSASTAGAGAIQPAPWPIILVALGAFALIVAISFAIFGPGETALLYMARYSARLSFLLFILVLVISPVATLWPSPRSRWLRRQRRYFGLAFAVAHFCHLGALLWLMNHRGGSLDTVTLIGGGLAYLLIGLMALTSNDDAQRKLGPKRWRTLHLTGLTYVWLIFMQSYVGRLLNPTPPEPKLIFMVLTGLGIGAVLLRLAPRLRKQRRGTSPA